MGSLAETLPCGGMGKVRKKVMRGSVITKCWVNSILVHKLKPESVE